MPPPASSHSSHALIRGSAAVSPVYVEGQLLAELTEEAALLPEGHFSPPSFSFSLPGRQAAEAFLPLRALPLSVLAPPASQHHVCYMMIVSSSEASMLFPWLYKAQPPPEASPPPPPSSSSYMSQGTRPCWLCSMNAATGTFPPYVVLLSCFLLCFLLPVLPTCLSPMEGYTFLLLLPYVPPITYMFSFQEPPRCLEPSISPLRICFLLLHEPPPPPQSSKAVSVAQPSLLCHMSLIHLPPYAVSSSIYPMLYVVLPWLATASPPPPPDIKIS